jgi:hypothetical protein
VMKSAADALLGAIELFLALPGKARHAHLLCYMQSCCLRLTLCAVTLLKGRTPCSSCLPPSAASSSA